MRFPFAPLLALAVAVPISLAAADPSANRLTVLDEFCDIYYPNQRHPKLTTPQWIGEEGVEAALVLAIDDMRDHQPYENYLRPILERLKEIDGRAPVSIMSCKIDANEPRLQTWLREGVSIETHTVDHPCPILDKGNFAAAKSTYDRCVDHFFTVPNNRPVAFRTPCMDGINSASPRLFAEILMRATDKGNFLTLSSSIGLVLTADDPENPKDLVLDAAGQPRFHKYLLPGYINYIKDYPYPYLIGNMIWETPFCVPDDYEASRVFGDKSPSTVADMKAAIDAVVAKKGIWVLTFHPYAWIANAQIVELIDHVVATHGSKAKFLNLREVNERLEKNLLGGQSTRAANGAENGVRLLDLNNDGYLDAIIANEETRQTRVWEPAARKWRTTGFPAPRNVRFGIMNAIPCAYISDERQSGFWLFDGGDWKAAPEYLEGLELGGSKLRSSTRGIDSGVRFRDVDRDGTTELIVSNPGQNAIFKWSENAWRKLEFGLPDGVSIVTAEGLDNGVRFVDFNQDGNDDVIFSNEAEYGLWLNVPKLFLGFKAGWSRQIMRGRRGDHPEIPMISRGGEFRNNGAWFANDMMWVQNEDTAKLPDLVERVSFTDLLSGFQPPPQEPKEALQSMVVGPDHLVELVAHEPAVQDPVSFEWGADGTLWVVEMRDYPSGVDGRAGGMVKRLRDEDGDGFYESSSVFLNHLNCPNGIMPWRNGVLISAAPDILFAEDTNQDGKADRTEVLFRGFREGNQQHRMNGFELGLDNWIHGANGDSGGVVENTKGSSISISGRDFRFRPGSGEFEATSGQTQFGKRRDDWGNWFGGANYTWGWHYFMPEEYLRRNPSLAVKSSHRTLNASADGTRVFSISRVQQRFNDIGMAGHVTSACGFAPYRDELFGPEFERSIFISEPTHNLVHREVLEPDGVSFRSHRAASEQGREFLASTDPWFRPTTVKTGPDGAIYIADMYRLVIEHPEWIPDDARQRLDVRSGEDKGRIYRVRPKGVNLRKPARLHELRGADLARAMDSPNGWQRDTVQRLLIEPLAREEEQDEAVRVLMENLRSNPSAKVRLQSLCAISGLGALRKDLLISSFKDAHPSVREHAVRLSEPFLPDSDVREAALSLINDPEIRVRNQLAFSLGECDSGDIPVALAKLVTRDGDNPDMITAVISSSANHGHELLVEVLRLGANGAQIELLVNHLVDRVVAGKGDVRHATMELKKSMEKPAGWKLVALARLLEMDKNGHARDLADLSSRARRLVARGDASDRDRAEVLRLVSDVELLASLLGPGNSLEFQAAALERIGKVEDPRTAPLLLARWNDSGPRIRNSMFALLLRREAWTKQLLQRIKGGALAPAEFGASARQALLEHSSDLVREEAAEVFKPAASDRRDLVAAMLPELSSLVGDPGRGRAVFDEQCAACHRAGEVGWGAGPNLAMLYDQTLETILTAVLDPNRAVEEKYRNYNIELKNGEEHAGILLNESGNSVTLMGITGAEQTFPRRDIARLQSSGRSMMPEGFEQFLRPQDFADLIAFVRAPHSASK
jgi:putative membrane-bound dehydrogenase-like protein